MIENDNFNQDWGFEDSRQQEIFDSYIKDAVQNYEIDLKEQVWLLIENRSWPSEIEKLMLLHLIFSDWAYWQKEPYTNKSISFNIDYPVDYEEDVKFPDRPHIYDQYPVGPYKLDLAIKLFSRNKQLKIAIECDGHDFHEKTKEQASRDKKRDRYLQSQGWFVLRFTGSDIYNRGPECAEEVTQFLVNWFDREVLGIRRRKND